MFENVSNVGHIFSNLAKFTLNCLNDWMEFKHPDRELREFFNCATKLVIMLSLYMFQFTMLFTSWCICSDDIMTSVVSQLIQLSLTLKSSLEFFVCSPGAQFRSWTWSFQISNSKQYRLYCTKRDLLTWTSPRWASQSTVRNLFKKTHIIWQLK